MKQILVIISLFFAQFLFAQNAPELRKQILEGKTDCNGSVYSSDQYAYYANKSILKVWDLNTGKNISEINMFSPITSIKTNKNKLFVLTENHLEIWDLAGQQQIISLSTHPSAQAPFNFYEQPRGMDISDSKIYIAHGLYGITVIDQNTNSFAASIPVKSTVRDIAIINDKAVVVIDNNTEGGFHGFAMLNLNTNQIVRYSEFENVFPESVSILGDTLLVGFFSTIWKYKTTDVFNNTKPEVLSRVYNFPAGFGSIVDKAYYDEKNMYACYEARDANGGNPRKQIVVFDRNQLGL